MCFEKKIYKKFYNLLQKTVIFFPETKIKNRWLVTSHETQIK